LATTQPSAVTTTDETAAAAAATTATAAAVEETVDASNTTTTTATGHQDRSATDKPEATTTSALSSSALSTSSSSTTSVTAATVIPSSRSRSSSAAGLAVELPKARQYPGEIALAGFRFQYSSVFVAVIATILVSYALYLEFIVQARVQVDMMQCQNDYRQLESRLLFWQSLIARMASQQVGWQHCTMDRECND
jgi:hypothetical protein